MPRNKTHDSHPGSAGHLQQPIRHLTQDELAARWCISPRTLERWRWIGEGVPFIKVGGTVRYRLDDIETFEVEQRRTSTAATPAKISALRGGRP